MHANDHPRPAGDPWQHHAACTGKTPLFFPQRGENGGDLGAVAQAKAICASCPVLVQCRTYAVNELSSNEPGIWGGMTRDERRAARRRMLAARRRSKAPAS